jgi:hypothetical protein
MLSQIKMAPSFLCLVVIASVSGANLNKAEPFIIEAVQAVLKLSHQFVMECGMEH